MKFPNQKRIVIAVMTGAILGILCIIGVGTRIGFSGNLVYLIGMWYNRVIMGMMIGLSGDIVLLDKDSKQNSLLRGTLLGILVSTAIFLSTTFRDIPSFFAGIAYGIIIDYVSTTRS